MLKCLREFVTDFSIETPSWCFFNNRGTSFAIEDCPPEDGLFDQFYLFFFWGGDAEGLGSTCSRVFFSRWTRRFQIEINLLNKIQWWIQRQAKLTKSDGDEHSRHARFTVQTKMNILMTRCFCQKKIITWPSKLMKTGMEFPQGWKFWIPKRSSPANLEHQDANHLDI